MLFHPLAEIFPLMEGAEFDELVASIKANGLREPITLIDGAILDGRNRFRACEVAGVEPCFVKFVGANIYAFVADMNLHRRHMNPSQLGLVGAKMATLKEGNPHKDKNLTGPIGPVTPSIDQVAAMLGIGSGSVKRGKLVLAEGTPEEIQAVEQGKVAVSTAAATIRARSNINRGIGTGKNNVGKNPERIQVIKINADIWKSLGGALEALAGLPNPTDVARLARGHIKRTLAVEARLSKSIQWLTEFDTAWRQKDAA